ncbi:MAG: hypothetical protein ACK4K7_07615 [Allosphingosinicella sp.]|uniref:hypothetical protein n=1 Tax=Allosphingosinicella sp. TaxID=2823234 RepID=UPI0039209D2B
MSRSRPELGLGSRLLIGAIAGFVGTMAMTSAMRKLHKRLPPEERYPLTPREIIDSTAEAAGMEPGEEAAKDATTASHFLYGAGSGALLGALNMPVSPVTGAVAGVAVWLGSYMGWIPAGGILKPATDHPARRNGAMIAAHIVWGWSTAKAMRELVAARETIFAEGPDKDVPHRDGD